MSELNLILLGPPGAGKGTQAQRLVDDFDLPYYATGDILRGAVKDNTELGREAKEFMDKGELVPDDLGRSLTAAMLIDASDDEVMRRISGRRICVKSGHVYHVDFDPPKNDGICDQDGSRLIQRDDDRPDTVQKRLSVYHEQTKPVIEWYEKAGLLRRFDGDRSPEDVHDHLRATLATLKLEGEL